jgi:hypothetical protein
VTGQPQEQAVVEFTTCRLHSCGVLEPLSGGHFEVGAESGGIVFFPDENAAMTAAIEYARKLTITGSRHRFIVRRTETRVVWNGDTPCPECGRTGTHKMDCSGGRS